MLNLSRPQRQELLHLRDHHPKPYVRERAAALLKIASGLCVRHVAAHGLLRPRAEETVADWLNRYQVEGLAGLGVRKGRGRKPAFSPEPSDAGPGRPSGATGRRRQPAAVGHRPVTLVPGHTP
jgi:hypothetical protein